jgi:hypothetical protein
MLAAAAVLMLCLAGCGLQQPGAKNPPKPDETAAAGVPVPEALVNARCTPDPQGVWSAYGAVRNPTKKTASYEVVVHVGPTNGEDATAVVAEVSDVAPGKTAEFTVAAIQAATPEGPCHIQVRTAKSEQAG